MKSFRNQRVPASPYLASSFKEGSGLVTADRRKVNYMRAPGLDVVDPKSQHGSEFLSHILLCRPSGNLVYSKVRGETFYQ